MVSPILLDREAQAAVAAARTSSDNRLLLAPRVGGSYAAVAVLGVIEQVGRTPGGESAVVVRGVQRVRIGAGVTGPGAALWVQATTVEPSPPTSRTSQLASEYKSLVVSILQQRGAWQVVDNVQRVSDPSLLAN